jgi:diguanylate cyclase (GGDEF)-like protein
MAGGLMRLLSVKGRDFRFVRDRPLSVAYVAVSALLIAVFPLLRESAGETDYLVLSLASIPAVFLGLRRIAPGKRGPWWLLLSGLMIANVAIVLGLVPGDRALVASYICEAVGNAVFLVSAVALVLRQGRDDLGAMVDTTIVALATAGLLWDAALAPNLSQNYSSGLPLIDLFVSVFALCGVLGALVWVIRVTVAPAPALWLLMAALLLALAGYLVVGLSSTGPTVPRLARLLFMGVYAAVSLFGVDPTSPRLADPAPVTRQDSLSIGRLVVLGTAVASIPVIVGIRVVNHGSIDGLLLAVGGPSIAALVMVRIGRLSVQRDEAEQALRFDATHDPLTGLVNRREFVDRVRHALTRHSTCAVLFCDLDGFKGVNDRLGHSAGDQLLVEMARRLQTETPSNNVVSRFGGDEFVVLVTDTTDADIEHASQAVGAELSRPVIVENETVRLGASIGVAKAAGEVDPEELIKRADQAMYKVKRDATAVPGIRRHRSMLPTEMRSARQL